MTSLTPTHGKPPAASRKATSRATRLTGLIGGQRDADGSELATACNLVEVAGDARAAIRAGTEIQALALTTRCSQATFAKVRKSGSEALDARDAGHCDCRTGDS